MLFSLCVLEEAGEEGTISLFGLRNEPFIQRLRTIITLVTDHTKVRADRKCIPLPFQITNQ